jgi:hypothetical protein
LKKNYLSKKGRALCFFTDASDAMQDAFIETEYENSREKKT